MLIRKSVVSCNMSVAEISKDVGSEGAEAVCGVNIGYHMIYKDASPSRYVCESGILFAMQFCKLQLLSPIW